MSTKEDKPFQKYQTIYLPKGVLVWPKVLEPDYKWKKEGEYGGRVSFAETEWLPIKAKLEAFCEEFKEELLEQFAKDLEEAKDGKTKKAVKEKIEVVQSSDAQIPGKYVPDDEGNDTDQMEIKFSKVAKRKDKKTNKLVDVPPPPVFDSQGRKFSPKSIWGGSEAIVAVRVMPYFTPKGWGVRLDYAGMQIIKLVTAGEGGGDLKFGSVEGGYVAEDDQDDESSFTSKDADSDSDDDEDEDSANF